MLQIVTVVDKQMGSLLDAACCAGTCRKPLDIGNLDVSKVCVLLLISMQSL